MKKKLSGHILAALESRGHTSADIDKMSPAEIFDEYCQWHGLIQWGPILRGVMREAERENLK